MRVWYRSVARIWRMCSGSTPPKTPTTCSSPAARVPQEIIEIIIVNIIYDKRSLRACSLTCYSWYIAAVPHLHRTLVTRTYEWDTKCLWPNPLIYMHRLGLLPLAKKLQITGGSRIHGRMFIPGELNRFILPYFAALTNVQELGMDYLDISEFMPRLRRRFGHFLPTVRSLALRAPRGTHRQIIYFIGLFRHLEDLKLLYQEVTFWKEPADDPRLVPAFVPPLRGRLTMTCFTRVGLLKVTIALFGGIRFHHMDLFNVYGTRLLLHACAKTLETFRLYPSDPRGEGVLSEAVRVLANKFTVKSSLGDFDLSRNKSLRTLETTARSVDGALGGDSPDTASTLLEHALSTITPPTFFRIIVVFRD